MTEAIVVALITGAISLAGSLIANNKTQSLLEYRLKQLEEKQDKHNSVIERTYHLEERVSVAEEKIKVANNRLADLEKTAQNH